MSAVIENEMSRNKIEYLMEKFPEAFVRAYKNRGNPSGSWTILDQYDHEWGERMIGYTLMPNPELISDLPYGNRDQFRLAGRAYLGKILPLTEENDQNALTGIPTGVQVDVMTFVRKNDGAIVRNFMSMDSSELSQIELLISTAFYLEGTDETYAAVFMNMSGYTETFIEQILNVAETLIAQRDLEAAIKDVQIQFDDDDRPAWSTPIPSEASVDERRAWRSYVIAMLSAGREVGTAISTANLLLEEEAKKFPNLVGFE